MKQSSNENRPKNFRRKIPNALTIVRILLIPLSVLFLYLGSSSDKIIAASIFTVAGLTDMLDGYLARRWSVQSKLGSFLDPIADKMLVVLALVMLVANETLRDIHILPVLLIICREMFVSGARNFMAQSTGDSMNVITLSKWKTAIQFLSMGPLMLAGTVFDNWLPNREIGLTLLWISTFITLYTMFNYGMSFYKSVFSR